MAPIFSSYPMAGAALGGEGPPPQDGLEGGRGRDSSRSGLPADEQTLSLSGLRVAMVAHGTRGDVQPVIALGTGLRARGCVVKVVTSSTYEKIVTDSGLDYAVAWPDMEAELKEDAGLRKAMAEGDLFAFLKAAGENGEKLFPQVFEKAWAALEQFKPQLVLHGIMAAPIANMYCRTHAVPAIQTYLQMLLPTSEVAPLGLRAPPLGLVHKALWWLTFHGFVAGFNKEYEEARKHIGSDDFLRLVPTTSTEFTRELLNPEAMMLIGVSPLVLPIPKDVRAPNIFCTGWWRVSEEQQTERFLAGDNNFGGAQKEELIAFLEAGEPPVYIGWGSMISVSSKFMTDLAVSALKATGRRGVVHCGWGGLSPELLDDPELIEHARTKTIFVKTAPHEWLLPKCAASVIHGGSGTTAAAMMSGRPTIVTPVWVDQHDFAAAVARLGNGVALGQFKSVTTTALAEAIERCLGDPNILSRAAAVRAQLQQEDGIGFAIGKIEEFVEGPLSSGEWRRKFDGIADEYSRGRGQWWQRASSCCTQ